MRRSRESDWGSGRRRPARKAKTGWDRAVTYRIYPTARQREALVELLACQRELYNAALEERRGVWRWERRQVTLYDQFGQLSGDREGFEWLARFGIAVARGTLVRLDEAFRNFFRRLRDGERPGFPRFRGIGSWSSVQWADTGGWKLNHFEQRSYGRLCVKGVGQIRVKVHRVFGDGAEARKLVVHRRGARWEATVFWRNVSLPMLAPTGRACGIDVGIDVLAAVADDQGEVELVANPRHFQRRQDKLAAAQRALARCAKTGRREGGRRNRAKVRLVRLHTKVRQTRRDAAHRLSARMVRDFDLIAHEDLEISTMTRSARGSADDPGRNVAAKGGLNRSILDAGWGQLLRFITYKAASAGRMIQRVPAAYTSQTCARCGHTARENRISRGNFGCVVCGHQAHADANAAAVILAVALGKLTIRAPRLSAQHHRPEPGHQPVTAGRDAATSCGS